MSHDSTELDLRRIGGDALVEVLGALQLSPATIRKPSDARPVDDPANPIPNPISVVVHLLGPEVSGNIVLCMPAAFAGQLNRVVTGSDPGDGEARSALGDAAGELGNMVAGRIAARLGKPGRRCTLGTPVIRWEPRPGPDALPGSLAAGVEAVCGSHGLTLDLRLNLPHS